jgi:hypothetical protein
MQDPKVSTVVFRFPNPIDVTDLLHYVGLLLVTSRMFFVTAFQTWHKVVLQKVQENFRLDLTDEGNARLIDLLLFLVRLKCIVHSHMWTTHTWQMRSTILFTSSTKGGSPRKPLPNATSSELPSYAYTIMQTFFSPSLCILSPSYPTPTLNLSTLTFPTVLMLSYQYSWMLRIDLQ